MVFAALLMAHFLTNNTTCKGILGIIPLFVAGWVVIDTLITHTSISFINRFPANPLRSGIFALFSLFTIIVAFAVFFVLANSGFTDKAESAESILSLFRAVYFSFVTITTLGYGDIVPLGGTFMGYIAQLLVMLELVVGLYFLLIILATVASWGNSPPSIDYPFTLEDLYKKYAIIDREEDKEKSSNP
jgi:hypothetical protein